MGSLVNAKAAALAEKRPKAGALAKALPPCGKAPHYDTMLLLKMGGFFMSLTTFDLGPIRPTSEAASLLLRVTQGCAWNNCRFCNNYRTHPFALRPVELIKREIDVMAMYRDRVMQHRGPGGDFDMDAINAEYAGLNDEEKHCYAMLFNWIQYGEYSMFLQDADAVAIKTGELVEILSYVRKQLPETTRITSYGRPDTLARKSAEEYKAIYEAGLGRIHAGFETGCDEVLKRITKGCTAAQEIQGGRNVMESGVELSVFLMAGIGGKKLSNKNADETAEVINAVNPSFVRLRTAVVIKGTPLWDDQQAEILDECSDMEQLQEMRRFLAGLKGCTGRVYSDHMINLLQELEGPLTELPALLAYMDEFLNMPRPEQRRFQLAKRMGFNGTFKQMDLLSAKDLETIDQTCAQIPDGEQWETLMKDCLRRYI
jgi:hypothetical protein